MLPLLPPPLLLLPRPDDEPIELPKDEPPSRDELDEPNDLLEPPPGDDDEPFDPLEDDPPLKAPNVSSLGKLK